MKIKNKIKIIRNNWRFEFDIHNIWTRSFFGRTYINMSDSLWNIAWSSHENKICYSIYTLFRVQWSNVDVCEVVEGGRGKVFFM
jgi:hypothetical protein